MVVESPGVAAALLRDHGEVSGAPGTGCRRAARVGRHRACAGCAQEPRRLATLPVESLLTGIPTLVMIVLIAYQ